jgi:formyltetrahydrofolate deformylase
MSPVDRAKLRPNLARAGWNGGHITIGKLHGVGPWDSHDPMNSTARLLITCPDRPGIVAAVGSFMHAHGANITSSQQHSTDPEGGTFFMRLEFQTPHLDVAAPTLESSFRDVVGRPFQMEWRFSYSSSLKRTAILVSKYDHALLELLWLHDRGELPTEIDVVVSNHPDLQEAVESFGIRYQHIPVASDDKARAEALILEAIEGVDLVVLARYMQILSGPFVEQFANRIINIHHSFLPAFVGANPYRQACERGVKIIGATAHYVTEELDAGPIIAQDVVRVDHQHTVKELTAKGRRVERDVLARAVRWHLEDRILIHGNKTIVFA